MNVLVACEESQEVCKAFREKGHNAFSCDVQEPSGGHPEWHILGDALEAINGGEIVTMDGIRHNVGKWDLLIAHPPCTYLSNVGAAWLYKKFDNKSYVELERLNKGFDAKEFFLKFYNAPIDKIAIENPIPSGVYRLPKYSQVIQPYEYGHPYSKKRVYGSKDCRSSNRQKLSSQYALGFRVEAKRLMEVLEKIREQPFETANKEAKPFRE